MTYIVSRRGKKLEVRATMWWYESAVKSIGDKSKLEGIFPLAYCYQPSLIRHRQLGHSYLHNTFTPRPRLRRRTRRTVAASKLTAIQFSTLDLSVNLWMLKKHIVRGAVRDFWEWWEIMWGCLSWLLEPWKTWMVWNMKVIINALIAVSW